jgi:vacuolar-type H+-ATPase subunit H
MNARKGDASSQTQPVSASGDLALLLETEQALEELLRRARDEASAILEAAYSQANAGGAALDREMARALQRFQTELEAERQRRAAEVLAEGRGRAAQLDAIGADRVAELGGLVLSRLLSGIGG